MAWRWDGTTLRLIHELSCHQGSVTWLEHALLLMTVLVAITHLVTPVRVRRIRLWAQLLLFSFNNRVQEGRFCRFILPVQDVLIEIRVGIVIQLTLHTIALLETSLDVVSHR